MDSGSHKWRRIAPCEQVEPKHALVEKWSAADKPDPVTQQPKLSSGDHFSGADVAADLERPTRRSKRCGQHLSSLFGLSPSGVYPATLVTKRAVRSYRTLSPLPAAEAA